MRAVRAICLVTLIAAATSARGDVTLSKQALKYENALGVAAVRLGAALQKDDVKALDAATRNVRSAVVAFTAYLAAYPAERTPAVARIVTGADKLAKTAERLRALLDHKADDGEIRMVAIDALHRYNELIEAHQGEPARKDIPYPDALVERFVTMVERIAHDAQVHKADCKKMGAALAAHADDDVAILQAIRDIDEARPQDQREAEREVVRSVHLVVRYNRALDQRAPMFACKADLGVATYLKRVNP